MESAFLVALTSGGEKRHVLLKLELKLYTKDLQELAGGMRMGEGPNYLCMPKSSEYNSDLKYREVEGSSTIHDVEYEFPVQGTHDDNALFDTEPAHCDHDTGNVHLPSGLDRRVLRLPHAPIKGILSYHVYM